MKQVKFSYGSILSSMHENVSSFRMLILALFLLVGQSAFSDCFKSSQEHQVCCSHGEKLPQCQVSGVCTLPDSAQGVLHDCSASDALKVVDDGSRVSGSFGTPKSEECSDLSEELAKIRKSYKNAQWRAREQKELDKDVENREIVKFNFENLGFKPYVATKQSGQENKVLAKLYTKAVSDIKEGKSPPTVVGFGSIRDTADGFYVLSSRDQGKTFELCQKRNFELVSCKKVDKAASYDFVTTLEGEIVVGQGHGEILSKASRTYTIQGAAQADFVAAGPSGAVLTARAPLR